jgi:hypothetical protein
MGDKFNIDPKTLPKSYIFIDESGDPVFYGNRKKLLVGQEGYQPYLIIGLIETADRVKLRKAVLEFIDNIRTDPMYNSIPSVMSNEHWYVHARGDHPEIRAKFFEMLRKLPGFKAHVVIAKKQLSIFNKKHNNNPTEFYFDVLHHLMRGRLTSNAVFYKLYLSQRGNNSLHHFEKAVAKALTAENIEVNYNLEVVQAKEMPELSIIDYLIWAVQRKLQKNEPRYFNALKEKFETLLNLYEDEAQ